MHKAQTIGISVLAAIIYGSCTTRSRYDFAPEYFTLAYPALFPTSSPTVLAFCWGLVATIWMGAVFGGVLAVVRGRMDRRGFSLLGW